MPPKKRALAESDANAQPAPKRNQKQPNGNEKAAETGADKAHEEEHQKKHKEIEDKQPHEYICFDPPYWCKGRLDDDDEDEDEDEGDEDENDENENVEGGDKEKMFPKSASEHPTYKWVMLWQSWSMLCDWIRRADYTNPDLFDMYIYNDFHWYGLAELLENLLADFDKAKTKHGKAKDTASLLDMWAPLATLAHWINMSDAGTFQMMDDGARTCKLIGLVGSAFVTMLATLDREEELKADGTIKDLGLVISLYMKWARGQEDYGIDDEDLEWRSLLIPYAKKAGINMMAAGCGGTADALRNMEEGSASDMKKVDKRFGWTKTLREYKKRYCRGNRLGGESYNIMRMSRRERAEHAFDKKDPLANFSLEDIEAGNLAIA